MGKGHKHLKKLKSEKAKVKLKGSKTLPKNTNVTDTNFKIKQIIVPEQLKTSNTVEPLSKRKLNIQELLSRLQHYNTTAKRDAIADLKEIIALYSNDVVSLNLNRLINGVSHLILDKEKSVRRDSFQLISLILTQVSVEYITPFFDTLSSYFRCAMTHIDSTIQEDSLLLLDILLTHVPSLVATHSNKILENLFDLISKLRTDSKPGRTLTLNLGSHFTNVKWRIQVLNRLHYLLDAIINDKLKHKDTETKTINTNLVKYNEKQLYYSIFQNNYLEPCLININDVKNKGTSEENKFVKYVDILVPLLLETWLEVGPNEKENETDTTLTEDTTAVLNCILNIFYLLYKFLILYQNETGDNEIVKGYILKYRKDFSRFIILHFPYNKIISQKRKRNENNVSRKSVLCVTENIMICTLFCIFNPKINFDKKQKEFAAKITCYVQKSLEGFTPENEDETKHTLLALKSLLLDVSKSWNCCKNELFDILNSSLDLYKNKKLTSDFKNGLFNILCEIVHFNQFNNSPRFHEWLNGLPDLLCQKIISEKTIDIINFLVKQNNTLFNNSVKDRFNDILNNLNNIKILDTKEELSAKCKIISMVHFIPLENNFNYMTILASSNCHISLKKYLQEILILKFEQRNEHEVVNKLRTFY